MELQLAIKSRKGWPRRLSASSFARIGLVTLIFNFTFLIPVVLAGDISTPCLCSGVPCEKNVTSSDCPSGRVISRRDCSCCSVCAKQLTDECNERELPCDNDFGLICGKDQKCEAEKLCSDDTECSTARFCFGGACADPCKVLPDVCKDDGLSNGICVVRSHRALCSCPTGQSVSHSKKECVPIQEEEAEVAYCENDGRKVNIGEKIYTEKCGKICDCGQQGELTCQPVTVKPECKKDFVPMSTVTGEMSEACKILVGNDAAFDGCCVPEKCRNVTSQDEPIITNKGRDYKLSESQNNLGEEEGSNSNSDKLDREMLLGEEDHKVLTEILQKEPKKKDPSGKKDHSALAGGSSEVKQPLMKVTVSGTTSHSAAITLPVLDKEAILSIALSTQLKNSRSHHSHDQDTPESSEDEANVWKEHRIPAGLPSLTLADLLPDTSYTVKYSVGDKTYPSVQFRTLKSDEVKAEEEDKLVKKPVELPKAAEDDEEEGSELTTVMIPLKETEAVTEPGTTHANESDSSSSTTLASAGSACLDSNGTSHELGSIVSVGCDQSCECMKNGQLKCLERCSIPFFKKGSFAHDPLCFEEPSGVDDCCVIVACARNSHAGAARELSINPCDSVKCGQNADCRYEVSPAGMQAENQNQETLCVCKEGFLGDPYDDVKGCEAGIVTPTLASPVVSTSIISSQQSPKPTTATAHEKKADGCVSNNKTFEYGEEYLDGCSYKCHCENSGEFLCLPRCSYRRDEETEIPKGCELHKDPSDPECCEMLHCPGEDSGTSRKDKPQVPTDGCVYKNSTYEKDEKFYDGCEQQCMCFSNGDVTCQPRCPPAGPNTTLDKDCITLPDPTDNCCTVTVCGNHTVSDVMKAAIETERKKLATTERGRNLNEESAEVKTSEEIKPTLRVKISMVMAINDTSMMISVQIPEDELSALEDEDIVIRYAHDKDLPESDWNVVEAKVKELFVEGSDELHTIISGLLPGKQYFFKVKVNGTESAVEAGLTKGAHEHSPTGSSVEDRESHEDHGLMSSAEETVDHSGPASGEEAVCKYKNKMFAAGEEFYDGCEAYCACEENGTVQCVPIECPTDFGLELLDPHCVKWEPLTTSFDKSPPNCCQEMKCLQNSTCQYEGLTFTNFQEIPQKLTGCEKRCYCEYGNVTCQNTCPPMSDKPPSNLPCPPEMAMPVTLPHDECCLTWVCRADHQQNLTINGSDPSLFSNPPHNTGMPLLVPHNINGTIPHPHLIHHGIIDDEEDQFVPPSTGNQPSIIPLDSLHPHQLQELLHQLSTHSESSGGLHPFGQGVYLSVKRPEEIRDLERIGAKVVGQGTDGSFVLVLPPSSEDNRAGRPPPQSQRPPNSPFPPRPRPRPLPPHLIIPGTGPDHFPFGPHFQHPPSGPAADEISGVMIRPLNESTLHIDFTVSAILVGLHGAVEVLYTKDFRNKPNPDQWERQLFQQPEDIIDNSHLQLFLTSLLPDTEYHIQIQVIMSDIHNAPISDIFVIRTLPPAPPPEIKIDPEIKVVETTSHTAEISWRKFTDFESSLIDGVQVKFKAYDNNLYDTTELIHRSISSYKLTHLQAGTKYEVDLLLVPFTNQTTELKSENAIHIETPADVDDYSFTISLETGKITEQTAELIWEGVPFPEDKFVSIYQVIYQSDNQKEQKSYFKVANRESNKKATLIDLKPGTRYSVWLEAFLTNGKKKRSNVIDVQTKVGLLPSPEKSEQDNNLASGSRSQGAVQETTSYYGALVALAIVAAVSIIGIIVLLMILIKKQNQSKIPINDRKSESSYDNPSFKNYDVEANGHNKPSEL